MQTIVVCHRSSRGCHRVEILYRYDVWLWRWKSGFTHGNEYSGGFAVALNSCYMYYKSYPFFDLQHFAEIFTICGEFNSYTAKFVDMASRLKRAFKEVIVCKQLSNIIEGNLDLSLAVTIVHDEMWVKDKYNTAYPGLKFQQETNWGDWLSINPFMPNGNPNPETFAPDNGTPEEGEGDNEGGEEEGGEEGIDEKTIALILEIIRNR